MTANDKGAPKIRGALSEVICWRCNKPLGSNRTLVFDADGDKRYSAKGMWRHEDCYALSNLRPDGE